MCDFSGLTPCKDKGFTWQASVGKLLSPTQDLVHDQYIPVSAGVAVKDSGPSGQSRSFTYLHSQPRCFAPSLLILFIWGLEQNLLQVLLLGPPYGREEGNASKTLFSILSTHSFSTPGAFLSPSLWPQGPHHKTSRALFTAPSIVRWPIYMFWSTWPWPDVLFHGGKWNRHSQRFFWCWTPLTPSQQVVKGLLGHSRLVALTGYSDTWQLSSSFSSSSAELVTKGAHWELKWNWKLWTPLNFLEPNW